MIEICLGDCREILPRIEPPSNDRIGCLIYDPPWDDPDACAIPMPPADSVLAFTDGRRFGQVLDKFGTWPAWVFTWNTLSPWNTSPRRPLQQTKHCVWFGDVERYDRDGALWGDPPDSKKHPTTVFDPAHGRRLSDLWGESLRWLHTPAATTGAGGSRFARKGDESMRHAKPIGWLTCLIANCSDGLVVDPFCGSGAALLAAHRLGRDAIGIDRSEQAVAAAKRQLDQLTLF